MIDSDSLMLPMKYAVKSIQDTMRIDMEGAFTFADSPAFYRLLGVISKNRTMTEIRMNIRSVIYVDAAALSMLMRAYDAAKTLHMQLVFEEPQGQVKDALARASAYNALQIAA